ncbi:sensor histidine kinase [Streptomyces sp. SID12501]|uniref:histidine kinase n=1 Tax=Streptomyces sp. SID12501 TaxID=2706042 RepID=A0A6B3BVT5_9ACTN|nr:sensor histidine kinase [Streptomyces sp. SID12501]NEC88493.1 sensor histidine kinase [Streptomyces sp. SID12501]
MAGLGDGSRWPQPVVLPIGLAALLWPVARRPARLTVAVRAAVPAVLSGAVTAAVFVSGREALSGPGEIATLLCLLLIAVRDCQVRWAVVCGVLDAAAVLALPYREASGESSVNPFGMLLPVCAVAGLAGYLRVLDHRRRVAVTETQRAERLAMAADLHDFVAHHVTGILVQTQVAQLLATTDPERLNTILTDVERSATEALASMRRTVGLMREVPETGNTGRHPAGDLAALPELVEGFSGPVGPKAALHRDPSVPEGLPHEVQVAAYRVVQEALTNVRRHAADATEVTVGLAHDGRVLEVTVCDDGRGGTRLPQAARGGGFGLVGLTERVTALGGALRTGPSPEHRGWEVTATLPAEKTSR